MAMNELNMQEFALRRYHIHSSSLLPIPASTPETEGEVIDYGEKRLLGVLLLLSNHLIAHYTKIHIVTKTTGAVQLAKRSYSQDIGELTTKYQ